jgi:cytochrome c oxidase subunit 2
MSNINIKNIPSLLALVTISTFCIVSNINVLADAAVPWQIGFQDPASPIAEGIIRFHHDLMAILLAVTVFVTWMLGRGVQLYRSDVNPVPWATIHGTFLEIVWTIVPGLILVLIAIPSFALLYSVDEIVDPSRTLKIIGHQWYWSYEYGDFETEDGDAISFDSYLVDSDSLEFGQLRRLEVDNRIVLPVNTHIRLIITSADVLHSWTIPSFGVKMDACPGRLNQASVFVTRPGTFYGQCSEICGVNHGFIPICAEVKSVDAFREWIVEQGGIIGSDTVEVEVLEVEENVTADVVETEVLVEGDVAEVVGEVKEVEAEKAAEIAEIVKIMEIVKNEEKEEVLDRAPESIILNIKKEANLQNVANEDNSETNEA